MPRRRGRGRAGRARGRGGGGVGRGGGAASASQISLAPGRGVAKIPARSSFHSPRKEEELRRNHEKELIDEARKKQALKAKLTEVEKQIFDLERNYLATFDRSQGNAITGYDFSFLAAPAKPDDDVGTSAKGGADPPLHAFLFTHSSITAAGLLAEGDATDKAK